MIFKITAFSTVLSLLMTVGGLWLSRSPLTPIAIILAVVIPLIAAPTTGFFTVRTRLRLEAMQQELERLSSTDDLTGLYNRRFFLEHVQRQLGSPYRTEDCLLLLDIDNFKRINDTYGHEVGDKALRLCARTIGQTVRDIDVLARFGGEEFVVLLPDTPLEQASAIAERVRQRVADTPLELTGRRVTMTLSIGCSSSTRASDMADLIRSADRALYAAKARGRNRVEVASRPERLEVA